MPLLDESTTNQVKAYLGNLRRPIELVASLDDSVRSAQLRSLVEEIAALSDQVTARCDGSDARRPSFAIRADAGDGPGRRVEAAFAGLPMRHEFTSLLLALLHIGGHPPREDEGLLEAIRNLAGEYRFETYFELSCEICPHVVRALNIMAALNPNVGHVAIDGKLFRAETAARNVSAVPMIFLNNEPFGQGQMTLAEILAKLDTGEAPAAE